MIKKKENMKPVETSSDIKDSNEQTSEVKNTQDEAPEVEDDKDETSSKKGAKTRKAPENNLSHFPIVGIGASAGGLAAFNDFFSGIPDDSDPGMAFVVVQHLDPDRKSTLDEILKRHTRMQVSEAKDGIAVQPNCVYVIPPNRNMAIQKGALKLSKPPY